MIPADWLPYYRLDDGELIGYLEPVGDGVRPRTLFGFALAEADTPYAGEAVLEAVGLSYLAEDWGYRRPDGRRQRVAIGEVSPTRVVIRGNDYGEAMVGATDSTVLAVPVAEGVLEPWSSRSRSR